MRMWWISDLLPCLMLGAADSEDDRDDDLIESDTHWEDGFTSMVPQAACPVTYEIIGHSGLLTAYTRLTGGC
jgi:hypothetical protein